VLGDPLYGVPGTQVGLGRPFRHAARLGFTHPIDGRRMELESELPPDLAAALELARAAV
jgi:23S rRNA pseudouridine1911/1915/1917 synthase